MKHPFYSVVAEDFSAVNKLIVNNLTSNIPLVEEVSSYLINSGGKRLRPLLVLLSSKSCGYNQAAHLSLATVIEFLHTAMLLHDDVVDASELRRGRQTVNAIWGNPASVLVGDFLHSRAFQMMVEIGNMRVMDILSHATNIISEGEVQQLNNVRNPDITEDEYMQVITRKTAMLFQASAQSGAVLAGAIEKQELALRDYGLHLGLAFQLIDDVLDYKGTTLDLGKNIGDDLAEGKVTLPLIYSMQNGTAAQAKIVREAITSCKVSNLEQVIDTLTDAGGIEYTQQVAEQELHKAQKALEQLPESPYHQAMEQMVSFAVNRRY